MKPGISVPGSRRPCLGTDFLAGVVTSDMSVNAMEIRRLKANAASRLPNRRTRLPSSISKSIRGVPRVTKTSGAVTTTIARTDMPTAMPSIPSHSAADVTTNAAMNSNMVWLL
jgi:hypothetical protein